MFNNLYSYCSVTILPSNRFSLRLPSSGYSCLLVHSTHCLYMCSTLPLNNPKSFSILSLSSCVSLSPSLTFTLSYYHFIPFTIFSTSSFTLISNLFTLPSTSFAICWVSSVISVLRSNSDLLVWGLSLGLAEVDFTSASDSCSSRIFCLSYSTIL